MPVKISALPAAGTLTGAELVPIVQSGVTDQSTVGKIADFANRAYQYLTSEAGTNTLTATGPVSMTAYAVGQVFTFLPQNTNTGATTINITPSGGAALGAKSIFCNGIALVAGEIKISVPCMIEYDGTQFNILGPFVAGTIPGNVAIGGILAVTGNMTGGGSFALTGLMGVGIAGAVSTALTVGFATGMSGTTQQGVDSFVTGTSGATGAIVSFRARSTTAAAAFTCTDLIHFYADNTTKGAGSTITNQYGFQAADQTQGGTLNIGFSGIVSAGSGKYNLHMSGTAQNYLAGVTGIGIAASSSASLVLAGSQTGSASLRLTTGGGTPSAPVQGDIWSDGTVIYYRNAAGVTKSFQFV